MRSAAVSIDRIEDVYRTRYRALCRMAASVCGDVGRSHDVVQEGFVRALRARESFRGEGSVEGWVWRIVMRAALDTRGGAVDQPLPEDVEFVLPFPERDDELTAALAALSPRRRMVVFLRYYGGLELRQIAEVLGVREGTVSATLAQAHDALRNALGSQPEARL
jgi:RNA polymerase sigma-70 factor (ECF subfamily)